MFAHLTSIVRVPVLWTYGTVWKGKGKVTDALALAALTLQRLSCWLKDADWQV